ncbi:MAG: hypothetical protein GX328_02295 [Clostridiaceae bacterium]|nr:hypothetical protein [Clostridiaceae bacterium]
MITKKYFRSIDELQLVQYYATLSREDVGFHSEDGKIIVDAKSFIGLFGLDFAKPILVVSEDEDFHKKIESIGETVED